MAEQINLYIELTYDESIHPSLYPKDTLTKPALQGFRNDLKQLGILPPRNDTTRVPRWGVIQTCWTTQRNMTFHHQIRNKFHQPEGRKRIENTLHSLSIKQMSLIEQLDGLDPRITTRFPSTGPYASNNLDSIHEPEEWDGPQEFLSNSESFDNPLLGGIPSGSGFGGSLAERMKIQMEQATSDEDGDWLQAPKEYDKISSSSRTIHSENSLGQILGKHSSSRSSTPEPKIKRWKPAESLSGSTVVEDSSTYLTRNHLMALLKQEQDKNRKLEQEVQELRDRDAENAAFIADIKNECRQPFVVPSLLDAFEVVSKLTTNATIKSIS